MVNPYGGLWGSVIELRVKLNRWKRRRGWSWLTDYQRKRIEKFFGSAMAAYNTNVYSENDWQFYCY